MFRSGLLHDIKDCGFPIASLGAYSILLACRLWAPSCTGKHVLLYSDNWSAVGSLNSGAANYPLIRATLWEMGYMMGHGNPRRGAGHQASPRCKDVYG